MKNILSVIIILMALISPSTKVYAQNLGDSNLTNSIQKKIYKATIKSNKKVERLHKNIGRAINSKKLTFDEMMQEIENLEEEYSKIWVNHKKNVKNILDTNFSLLAT
tara:strand:+ start:1185 stop:1505 length:321 start_codon:yes stop_codon:yes gene_type:complete